MIIQPVTITVGQATIRTAIAELSRAAARTRSNVAKRGRIERALEELDCTAKSDLQLLSELHARTVDAAEKREAARFDSAAIDLRRAAEYLASARTAIAAALAYIEATAEIDDSAQDMPETDQWADRAAAEVPLHLSGRDLGGE